MNAKFQVNQFKSISKTQIKYNQRPGYVYISKSQYNPIYERKVT